MRTFPGTKPNLVQGQPAASFSARDLGLFLLVFASYVFCARFELRLIHSQTSMGVIWLPAGIALAAFLLRGRGILPTIYLASLSVELISSVPLLGALTIAAGNTAEVFLAGYLVNRFAGGAKAFSRPADVLRFSVLAGALATLISAIVGTSVVSSPAGLDRPEALTIFAAWWAGHALGVLVLTPFLVLLLNGKHQPLHLSELLEVSVLLIGLSIVSVISFGPAGVFSDRVDTPLFLCVPFLVWAGIRFCPLEAAGACIVLCGFATWGSLHGYGPFITVTAMPLSLAAYLCVATTMTLTGASTVANQREVSEKLLETLYRLETTKDTEIARLSADVDFLRDELIRRVHARSHSEPNVQVTQQPRESSEVIWFLEAETENILYVSPAYETVWGRSREDLGRDAHDWLDAVIPEDREFAIQFVGQDFPGDRVETTYRVKRPDGSIRWIFDRGFVIRDPAGRPVRYLGLASDITELVQLGEFIPARLEHRSPKTPSKGNIT
ncbi:MAG TPA: MASE1 domain-containing protein [Candidatus Limnocylindrales bacterium]|nr:MASE1 domain-containing protein [Candidatus Limnocylindrales bacterium]